MTATSDPNLSVNINAPTYVISVNVESDGASPYNIVVQATMPFAITDPDYYDDAVAAFANALSGLDGVTITDPIPKHYLLPENGFDGGSVPLT
jgi:hypothetical protein